MKSKAEVSDTVIVRFPKSALSWLRARGMARQRPGMKSNNYHYIRLHLPPDYAKVIADLYNRSGA